MTNKNLKFALLFSIGTIIDLLLLADEFFNNSKNQNSIDAGVHIGDLIGYTLTTIFLGCMAVKFWIKYKTNNKNI
jgi:hypothetical protein